MSSNIFESVNQPREFEKAIAFANVYAPNDKGGKTKIHGIPLLASVPVHVAMIEAHKQGKIINQGGTLIVEIVLVNDDNQATAWTL